MKKISLPAKIFALSIILGGCGGGGGGGHHDDSAPAPSTYTVGGSVSGLDSGASVTLQNNGGNALTVSSSDSFTFSNGVNNGAAYSVTVSSTSAGYTCSVTNGSGTVSAANVINILVSCVGAAPDPNALTVLSPTHKPTLVGIVVDSPVSNLNYIFNAQPVVTDSSGFFTYQQGDLITFKVGSIELPPVAGASIVTVQSIANAGLYPNRLTNIARFLQSLDSDANVSNGISISPLAHSVGLGKTLDFTQDVTSFASDANPIIASVHGAGGTPNTQLIDATTAVNQANTSLYTLRTSLIAGNWSTGSGSTLQVAIFLDDGIYFGLDANCGGVPSYEFGNYTVNASTFQVTIAIDNDHDGPNCGLNSGTYNFGFSGTNLSLNSKTWGYIFPAPGQLTGVYGEGDFTALGEAAHLHVFLPTGNYIEVQECQDNSGNSIPGVEAGTYTWNSSTKAFAITSHSDNGGNLCGHLSNFTAPITASVSTNSLGIRINASNDDLDTYAITPGVSGNNLLGGWEISPLDPNGEGGGIVIFTADGKVLASKSCIGGNDTPELGTFTWDSSTGSARVSITQDSNGVNCGMSAIAPAITQLQPHGNVLDIVTNSPTAGTISVTRFAGDGGLYGMWNRKASGSTPTMTMVIYRDGFDQWTMGPIESDCAITSHEETVTFDFDASTSVMSNVVFDEADSDVPGCGLPATFGGTITLKGDSLNIPGLGQFTRVQ